MILSALVRRWYVACPCVVLAGLAYFVTGGWLESRPPLSTSRWVVRLPEPPADVPAYTGTDPVPAVEGNVAVRPVTGSSDVELVATGTLRSPAVAVNAAAGRTLIERATESAERAKG